MGLSLGMKIDDQGNAVPGPTSVLPSAQLAAGAYSRFDARKTRFSTTKAIFRYRTSQRTFNRMRGSNAAWRVYGNRTGLQVSTCSPVTEIKRDRHAPSQSRIQART